MHDDKEERKGEQKKKREKERMKINEDKRIRERVKWKEWEYREKEMRDCKKEKE